MIIVYVLENVLGRHYVGVTANITDRLERHNGNREQSTRGLGPWSVIYSERYDTRGEALARERTIKSYKGGEAFRKLLSDGGGVA